MFVIVTLMKRGFEISDLMSPSSRSDSSSSVSGDWNCAPQRRSLMVASTRGVMECRARVEKVRDSRSERESDAVMGGEGGPLVEAAMLPMEDLRSWEDCVTKLSVKCSKTKPRCWRAVMTVERRRAGTKM